MANKKDNPGIYIPPPVIYLTIFLVAIFLQSKWPINKSFFNSVICKITGAALILIAIVFFLFRSLRQFFLSKNTVITVLPAQSLQTTGIYSLTRNPMYLGLILIYLGITCFVGNWWNLVLFPLLLLIVQEYIIKREEKYLERRFGQSYLAYKKKVGRWL